MATSLSIICKEINYGYTYNDNLLILYSLFIQPWQNTLGKKSPKTNLDELNIVVTLNTTVAHTKWHLKWHLRDTVAHTWHLGDTVAHTTWNFLRNYKEGIDDWENNVENVCIRDDKEYYKTDSVIVRTNNGLKDIKEYISVPGQDHLVGQQLFSKEAMERLWLFGRLNLPKNKEAIQNMIDACQWKNKDERYADFYNKNIKDRRTGYWDKFDDEYKHIGEWMIIRLADGSIAIFSERQWDCGSNYTDGSFFSICETSWKI